MFRSHAARFSLTLLANAALAGSLVACANSAPADHDAVADHDHDHDHEPMHTHEHGLFDAAHTHSHDGTVVYQDNPAPKNEVTIKVEGDWRIITSNGIPDHTPGQFPNRGNPNRISPQQHKYRVAAKPAVAEKVTDGRGWLFGVALNGVPFDPGTGEFWHGQREWNYDAMTGKTDLGLDAHHAHVQPDGTYHYHGLPTGLIAARGGENKMVLVGWAADGFPVYSQWGHTDAKDKDSELRKMKSSWRLKKGKRDGGPGGDYDGTFTADFEYVKDSGDLDECNGRVGVTPEYPDGIYHYYLTESYPFIARSFRGTPDQSFRHGPPGGGPGGPGGPGMGPGGPGGPGGPPPPGGPNGPPPGWPPPDRRDRERDR